MTRTTPVLGRRVQLALVSLALAATGCGVGAPASIDPSGVDGLEVPTPSPDSADFVEGVDNPRLPLSVGSEWTYETTSVSGVIATVTVTVAPETRDIAGVAATAVTTVTAQTEGRGDPVIGTDYFAQDRAGNVWAFGGPGWLAGVDDAQAGLVMPARPRVGDGFRREYAAGVAETSSEVLDVAASAQTRLDVWDDLVEIRDIDPLAGRLDARRFYATDVGLVLSETAEATTELLTHTPN